MEAENKLKDFSDILRTSNKSLVSTESVLTSCLAKAPANGKDDSTMRGCLARAIVKVHEAMAELDGLDLPTIRVSQEQSIY